MRNDYPFLLVAPSTLMEQVRQISEKNAISMSGFIRQSITRNLNAYATYENAVSTALSRSAQQRSAQ
jgi:hypothetical protein